MIDKKELHQTVSNQDAKDPDNDYILARFSVITKNKGPLTKVMRIDPDTGAVVKDGSQSSMCSGIIQTKTTNTLHQFAEGLRRLEFNQALVHGISEYPKSFVTTTSRLENAKSGRPADALPVIARSKEFLNYSDGPSLMMFDHDKARINAVAENEAVLQPLAPADLIKMIIKFFPEIANAGWVSTPSTSSCIYDKDGKELRGEGSGSHTYFFVENGQDIPRFLEVLGKRLFLLGYGRVEMSRSGALLFRTLVDLSVGSPERPDFAAGAVCEDGLFQKLPKPEVAEGTRLDTSLLPDLTPEEEIEYDAIKDRLAELARPSQTIVKSEYVEQEASKLSAERGVSADEARQVILSRQDHILADDDQLYFAHLKGEPVSVAEVLNNPTDYDKKPLADPLEPEYDGGSMNKARFYFNDGKPIINSFAHGQTKYTFERFQKSLEETIDRKSYEELLAEAQALNEDSSEEAAELVREAAYLSPIQKRRVHEAIKKVTRLPLCVLESSEKDEQDRAKEDENDHLQLAQDLAEKIGRDNVLAVQSYVYHWQNGVWQKKDDRSVKQWVQQYIGNKEVYKDDVGKNTVESVTDLFKTEVFQPDHQFDVGPAECVNMINGELELTKSSGKWSLQPHNREHYRTTQIPVKYDSTAVAPRFMKFMEEVFKGDPDAADKILALIEMIGYSLMAHCRHEKFIILVGTGANGKSVFLAVLEALVGRNNVAGVQPAQFDRSFQRAHLHGKLANIVTEIKQGEIIDDASLKGIVSGEPTTVEHKFKDPFVMRPFSTCWFGTNHMPHTRDFSDALFRRALVVEFNQVFKPEMGNCDPQLKDKLMEELPGILNIALTAYADALTNGFTTPESCIKARDNWRLEADQVAQFVDDKCERGSDNHGIGAGQLFAEYKTWANENGIHKQLGIKAFRDRLTRLGFGHKRTKTARMVTGIRLKADIEVFNF